MSLLPAGTPLIVDRGIRNLTPRYRKLIAGDWTGRLIVGFLFAVSAVGMYALTAAVMSSLLFGLVVASVALGVVALV